MKSPADIERAGESQARGEHALLGVRHFEFRIEEKLLVLMQARRQLRIETRLLEIAAIEQVDRQMHIAAEDPPALQLFRSQEPVGLDRRERLCDARQLAIAEPVDVAHLVE